MADARGKTDEAGLIFHSGRVYTVDAATVIDIYTRNPARATGLGEITGSIKAGKSADRIVLDRNLFETA